LEKKRGPEDPKVAHVLRNLAVFYRHQCQYAKAEPLFERALFILEKKQGPEDSEVAHVLRNLGVLYHHKGEGEYPKAESLSSGRFAFWRRSGRPKTTKWPGFFIT
jgi:Tetratricopeptide repeat